MQVYSQIIKRLFFDYFDILMRYFRNFLKIIYLILYFYRYILNNYNFKNKIKRKNLLFDYYIFYFSNFLIK